ncbi:MAG: hypothetical protein QF835_05195 [Candidatus Marinimicrobia bacterium]|nr:hypothetical protein [Candidatus Neomarinimicrobiota bacterium]
MMKTLAHLFHIFLLTAFIFLSCGDNNDDDKFYDDWTVTGSGLSADVSKNALTEFVGSTNCPYCPAADSLLLSYLDPAHENYVGVSTADKWFLINYHTYHPSWGDPMYEFLRGVSAENDYCSVRFGDDYGEGDWYIIGGVPTIFTNGSWSSINADMASGPLSEMTPVQISLAGTTIDGPTIQVRITISSRSDLTSENSLYLFIAATLDNVDYEGYNGEKHHQDVFLGWINEGLSGELLSITDKEQTKSYTWEMPSNWPQNNLETSWTEVEYDVANLQVVAFIQDQSTKEVLQVTGI